MAVTADYDSLLAKVIAWGENRAGAILRLRRALREFQVGGVATDLEFLFQIVDSPPFQAGNFDTTYLDKFNPPEMANKAALERDAALAAALLAHRKKAAPTALTAANAWRIAAWREQM